MAVLNAGPFRTDNDQIGPRSSSAHRGDGPSVPIGGHCRPESEDQEGVFVSKSIVVEAGPVSGGPCIASCGNGRFVLRCAPEMAGRARTELVDVLAGSARDLRPQELILDLAPVKFLNSAGIGAIFSLCRHVVNCGGMMVVCNARPAVKRLLVAVNLPALIPILGDLAEAHGFLDQGRGAEQ